MLPLTSPTLSTTLTDRLTQTTRIPLLRTTHPDEKLADCAHEDFRTPQPPKVAARSKDTKR